MAKKVETTKYLSSDEGKNKIWNTHLTEHYSAIKMNELPPPWMNLVIIMLR